VSARILVFAGLIVLLARLSAQPAPIPESEALYAPTPLRLKTIVAAAQRDGWLPHGATLRHAATLAYERDKLQAAEAWFHVYRWAQLWGQDETKFVVQWVRAVNELQVGHAHLAVPTPRRSRAVGAGLALELQAWLLNNATFSKEFFGLLSPVDYLPRVFEILAQLHQRDPIKFKSHASLALAIALVYDMAPPPVWPHAQVTPAALPRKLPDPTEAFAWWVKQEQLGRTYHSLARLSAEDLKFVVDTPAPWNELEWSQQACQHSLAQLAATYAMVGYRKERVAANALVWPGRSYALPDILKTGGICSDQAYFAAQVGKARGVPTLLIYGSGNDGRHAWFGFLNSNKQWQLDAGRYAEQRFVTGYARDPQTWREFSDHELVFLSERFRDLPSYRQSRTHADFAGQFLAEGRAPAAAAAARRAVNFERRNQAGWEVLIKAAQHEGRDARTIENILREAALAFQRYPDLQTHYINRTAASLRARGETSAATAEERRIATQYKGTRVDLSVQQASAEVRRAMSGQPLAEQVRVYNQILDTSGRGAGIAFFDHVVTGFAEHLLQLGKKAEASRAVERARQNLKIEPNSQLAREFEALAKRVREAK